MKRFSLPLISALLILCSCGSAEAKEPAAPKTVVEVVTDWSEDQQEGVREIMVNGHHCIQDRTYDMYAAAGGLSCDWNKGSSE